MKNTCCVADKFCTAAANYENSNARAVCFACGDFVCTKCSSRRNYFNYGRVRLCNNCQELFDGNDKRVMARLAKLAGS